jgi:two-component system cell cycle sensor histidine kinase PleC
VFDAELRLVAANDHMAAMLALPPGLVRPGTLLRDILAYQAARGDFGSGPDACVDYRIAHFWRAGELELERIAGDRVLRVRRRPLDGGGVVSVYTDITAAKRAEAALRQSEARFKEFAEVASDWLWEWDAEQRFSWLSERIAEALGRPQSFFIGKRREDIGRIDTDDPSWRAHLADVAARRPFQGFRYRSIYPERVRWFEQSGRPLFDAEGGFVGYRGTGREITALVEAEAQARLGAERLARAIGALPHAVGQFDRDGRMVAFNDAYRRMHAGLEDIFKVGLTFADLLRAAMTIQVPLVPEAERDAYFERRMAFHRNPVGTFERQLPGGVCQEIIETPLPDGGFLIIIHDVTARKRAEAEANRAQAELAAIFEAMPLVICVYDAEDRLVAWNRAFADMCAPMGRPLAVGMTFEQP